MKMPGIYINQEAMERAKTKEQRLTEKYFWRFIMFVVGIACGYAWFFLQD